MQAERAPGPARGRPSRRTAAALHACVVLPLLPGRSFQVTFPPGWVGAGSAACAPRPPPAGPALLGAPWTPLFSCPLFLFLDRAGHRTARVARPAVSRLHVNETIVTLKLKERFLILLCNILVTIWGQKLKGCH